MAVFLLILKWKMLFVLQLIFNITAAKITAGGNFVQWLWVIMDISAVRIQLFTISTAVKLVRIDQYYDLFTTIGIVLSCTGVVESHNFFIEKYDSLPFY